MEIRPLASPDLPAVAAVWNPIVRETAITFTSILSPTLQMSPTLET